MSMPKLTNLARGEITRRVLEVYDPSMSMHEIADAAGVRVEQACTVIKRNELPYRLIHHDTAQMVRAACSPQKSIQEVAAEIGSTYHIVYNTMRRHNLPYKHVGSGRRKLR